MSAAAPFEALAASMHFPQERARLSSIGREGNRACRILLPCLKQLQAQQNDIENMKENILGSSNLEVPPVGRSRRGLKVCNSPATLDPPDGDYYHAAEDLKAADMECRRLDGAVRGNVNRLGVHAS